VRQKRRESGYGIRSIVDTSTQLSTAFGFAILDFVKNQKLITEYPLALRSSISPNPESAKSPLYLEEDSMRHTAEPDCLDFVHKHHIHVRSFVLDKQIELLQPAW
jgi:hypothetical protein